jgi:hypothetical protein
LLAEYNPLPMASEKPAAAAHHDTGKSGAKHSGTPHVARKAGAPSKAAAQ